jgi:hypothetical protein
MTAQNSENVKAWQVYAYEGGAVGILAGDTFIASMATGSDAASNAARIVAAVNAHDALTARVAALEDALQGFVNESEGWFDEHTPAALLAEARALLLNGGA